MYKICPNLDLSATTIYRRAQIAVFFKHTVLGHKRGICLGRDEPVVCLVVFEKQILGDLDDITCIIFYKLIFVHAPAISRVNCMLIFKSVKHAEYHACSASVSEKFQCIF